MSAVPVVIVGAGPTGLTAATLLGQYGVECLVLDRWEGVYPAAAGSPPRRRDLPGAGPARGRRAVRRGLLAVPRTAAAGPGHAGARRVPPRHRDRPARLPRGEHVRPAGAGGHPAREPRAVRDRHRPRQQRGHRRHPGRRRPGERRGHRPGHRPGRVDPRRVRAGLRRRQQPDPGHDRRLPARPAPGAALAGGRRGHRRRPRPVGGRAPALRPAPGRHLHAGRSDPLPLGVPAAARRDRRRLPRPGPAAPADLPLDRRRPGRPAAAGAGGPIHLPGAAGRPVAGSAGVPARRRRPPHPAVHRAGHGRRRAGRGEPRLEAGRRARRHPGGAGAGHLPGRAQATRPRARSGSPRSSAWP